MCRVACQSDGTQFEESSYEMWCVPRSGIECEFLEKLPRTLDIMQKVFTSHFLELDWKPLKTECVLHLDGCGTKRAWTTIERSAEQRATAGPGAAKHECRTPGGIECNIAMPQTRRINDRWSRWFGRRTSRALLLQTEFINLLPRNS